MVSVESGCDHGDFLSCGVDEPFFVKGVFFDLSGHEVADVGDLFQAKDHL